MRTIKLALTIIAVTLWVYCEEYVCRGTGLFLGFAVILIGFVMEGVSNRWHSFLVLLGCFLSFAFYFGIPVGLHRIEKTDGVKIRSAFYTHIVDSGKRMEEKKLRSHYIKYHSQYYVENDTYYFLYNGKSCSMYNTHIKVLELPDNFSIVHKDFGHGMLDIIVANGKQYDMYGTTVTDGFKPYISDYTPDYTNSAYY